MKYIQFKFKPKRHLHDSGYRFLVVKGDKGENLGEHHDHILIKENKIDWKGAINIDVTKDGWIRIMPFSMNENWEAGIGDKDCSSLFIDRKEKIV